MMDRLPKKFAQPIHPSIATALPPSNLQWTQIRGNSSYRHGWSKNRNPRNPAKITKSNVYY